jgi:altronate hydrolase
VPASELKVALQCGGSDGYSGVSANPALGVASDLVVRNGGTVILSETTETYGAEHLFTRRAVSREVGEKLVELMHWWEEYTQCHQNSGSAIPDCVSISSIPWPGCAFQEHGL